MRRGDANEDEHLLHPSSDTKDITDKELFEVNKRGDLLAQDNIYTLWSCL